MWMNHSHAIERCALSTFVRRHGCEARRDGPAHSRFEAPIKTDAPHGQSRMNLMEQTKSLNFLSTTLNFWAYVK